MKPAAPVTNIVRSDIVSSRASVRLRRTSRGLFTRRMHGAAIPSYAAIAKSALKPYQGDEVRRAVGTSRLFGNHLKSGECGRDASHPAFDNKNTGLYGAALF